MGDASAAVVVVVPSAATPSREDVPRLYTHEGFGLDVSVDLARGASWVRGTLSSS